MSAHIPANEGVQEILGKLDDVELISLARTVTQGLKEIYSATGNI